MEPIVNIGADVAKDEIVVACNEGLWATKRLANRRAALNAWLGRLTPGSRIGLESTARYHELLAELAEAQGLVVYVLNPRDVHHYARAVGQRGKTDRVDAELIARYVAHEHVRLIAWVRPTHEQRQIEGLLRRRAEICALEVALTQSLKGESAVAQQLAQLKAEFKTLLGVLDMELDRLVAASVERRQTQVQADSIPGVGALLSSYLASLFERTAFHSAKAAVAFTGLDPRPDESGAKVGRRRLSKRGPAELRRLLFLAAMCWSRSGSPGRSLYEHYRTRGLSHTATLVVLARKIMRIAYALHKHGAMFDPSLLKQACATT